MAVVVIIVVAVAAILALRHWHDFGACGEGLAPRPESKRKGCLLSLALVVSLFSVVFFSQGRSRCGSSSSSDASWYSSHPYVPSRLQWSRNETTVKPQYGHGNQEAQKSLWKSWQATKPRSQNTRSQRSQEKPKENWRKLPWKTKGTEERDREREKKTQELSKKIPSCLIQGFQKL